MKTNNHNPQTSAPARRQKTADKNQEGGSKPAAVEAAIVGMGYVGLPLALQFARSGVRIVGLDIDPAKVEAINQGRSYIRHIESDAIAQLTRAKKFSASTDFSLIQQVGAVIICVPTPLNKNREPDISFILNTGKSVAPQLQRGTLVVLESTTYPGTTDEDLREVLEAGSGLKAGADFHLAFSPEREDPGNPDSKVAVIPKVIGGFTPACLEKAKALYGKAIKTLVPVSSCRAAEATKLLENTFRGVNIALVNELKVVYGAMDIDIWEVIQAAKTKPFGFMAFHPGPGLGGHCIPIDPFYLTWKAREYEFPTRFIELAGETNTAMPYHVVSHVVAAMGQQGKTLRGSRVLILGVAYKKDIDDVRESPALKIMELLGTQGAVVAYHDPFVPRLGKMRKYDFGLESIPLTTETLREHDCTLIVTDHSTVDYDLVVGESHLVVDTRNATARVTHHREKIVRC